MQLCMAMIADSMLVADVCVQWKRWHLLFCVLLADELTKAYETYHKRTLATGRVQ